MQAFLDKHQLPATYQTTAKAHFEPLITALIHARKMHNLPTFYVGINGCQGSGKTTLADYLTYRFTQLGLTACALSIDDFYLTQAARQHASQTIHPLLRTRGVPGTHDVPLALATLRRLAQSGTVRLPRFNKASDERVPESEWQGIQAPVEMVIVEGWCVGVTAPERESLAIPINALERDQDSDGCWRNYMVDCLAKTYQPLWQMLDYRVMLKAPSFETVYAWRLEQEEKLRERIAGHGGDGSGMMSAAAIGQFIMHYERLTRHALKTLPEHCDAVFSLDADRVIQSVTFSSPRNHQIG